jgi:hypothetical protein
MLALEPFEARRLGDNCVSGRNHLAEVEALRPGNSRPLRAAGLIHKRHLNFAHRLAGAVEDRAANPS